MTENYTNTIFLENAVPDSLIKKAIRDFDSQNKVSEPGDFARTDQINVTDEVTDLIRKIMNREAEWRSGNYYEHEKPYLPHTDWNFQVDNNINVVIPLRYSGELPYFIIFDQIWPNNSCSWMMDQIPPRQLGTTHLGVKGWPGEYPILFKTGKDINEELYSKHLTRFKKYTLENLSGKAYPFKPGNIMIFDNRRVHATGDAGWKKLGLSLRFKVEL